MNNLPGWVGPTVKNRANLSSTSTSTGTGTELGNKALYLQSTMPPTVPCDGCCVKMVNFIGTHHYQIKRTCTDTFEVNFFMVNHACMTEGHRHGHMCFCEEDECNRGDKIRGMSLLAMMILTRSSSYLGVWQQWWQSLSENILTLFPLGGGHRNLPHKDKHALDIHIS